MGHSLPGERLNDDTTVVLVRRRVHNRDTVRGLAGADSWSEGCETPGLCPHPRFGKSRSESLVMLQPFPIEVTNVSRSREWMYLYPSRPCIKVCEPIKMLNDIRLARPVLLNHDQAKVALPAFVSVGMAKL